MQQQGVGPLQVHGIPGTPVGDLFPPGNAVFGDGNRSSIRPIRAGELRSHSALLKHGEIEKEKMQDKDMGAILSTAWNLQTRASKKGT